MSRVVVFDYGSGNIHSVVRAVRESGAEVEVTGSARAALDADGLVVPGVGAFAACMAQLRAHHGDQMIRERISSAAPLLGICVGHQILFSHGDEHGIESDGVGVFPGTIRRLPVAKLPHMGWNEVSPDPGSQFFATPQRFYFVHSYAALFRADCPQDAVCLWSEHEGVKFIAAVEYGPVLSTQFHPEKSGRTGLALIQAWVDRLGV